MIAANEKTQSIERLLRDSSESVVTLLPKIVAINLLVGLFGKDLKRHWEYYGRLLYRFTLAHPAQAAVLASVLAQFSKAKEPETKPGALAGIATAAIVISVLAFRSILQREDLKQRLKATRRKFDSMVLPDDGTIYSADGKEFYQVKYRFGDSNPTLIRFVFAESGAKKMSRSGQTFDRKGFTVFINKHKLADVTDCIRPDLESF